MANIWITSDFHGYHKNLASGSSSWHPGDSLTKPGCRPFKDQYEMTDVMVENINKVVKADDILWHLGDWTFGGQDNVLKLRRRIRCKNIYHILGNHDKQETWDLPEVRGNFRGIFDGIVNKYLVPGQAFVMSHYAILQWDRKHHGVIHLFGHSHGSLNKWIAEHLPTSRMMDVDIGSHPEFRPYHVDEVLQIMAQKTGDDFIDHHQTKREGPLRA